MTRTEQYNAGIRYFQQGTPFNPDWPEPTRTAYLIAQSEQETALAEGKNQRRAGA